MKNLLKPLDKTANKYSHGTVCVVAGSRAYSGAAVLAVGGARRGGSGYVTYLALDRLPALLVLRKYPDVVLRRKVERVRATAWVVGPGSPQLPKKFALPNPQYLVLDSEAIKRASTLSAQWKIITPHAGELKHLGYGAEIDHLDRTEVALKIAKEQNVIIVFKGNGTVIATPSGVSVVDTHGGPELATAGTGDILAGLIGSMLASWEPENETQVVEVLQKALKMHGLAAKTAAKKNMAVTATDILAHLGEIER